MITRTHPRSAFWTPSITPYIETDGGRGNLIEQNDCQIRAIAITTGLPYMYVHMLAKRLGRKNGERFNTSDILPHIDDFEFQQADTGGYSRSVRQFVRTHPEGVFIVRAACHVVALVDGIIYDTAEAISFGYLDCSVDWYWRVLRNE